mgnify:CR=1 FL=1
MLFRSETSGKMMIQIVKEKFISRLSEFHRVNTFSIDGIESPVHTDDYCNGHSRFRCGNGDDKQGEEQALCMLREKEFIEGNEVNVD